MEQNKIYPPLSVLYHPTRDMIRTDIGHGLPDRQIDGSRLVNARRQCKRTGV